MRYDRRRNRKGNENTGNAWDYIMMKTDKYANTVLTSSRQLDEFTYTNDIIEPPYEPRELIALIERNDTLKQNIEAMASNVANFGHGIKYQDDFDYNKAVSNTKTIADDEWETLRILYKGVNSQLDFSALIYKIAIDMYSFGWGMLEVTRNGAGEVCGMQYCRACNFRLVKNEESLTSMKVWVESKTGYEQIDNQVRFKKFAQIVNNKKIYFKEFGDPRPMDYETGEYKDNLPEKKLATEIAYFSIHSSYTDYGIPYWINTAITASGNILSELLNYKYFHDGRILPMAILVSGGQLTPSSVESIRQSKGMDNAYKALLLEASPFEDDEPENQIKNMIKGSSDSKVSIDIKSLTDTNNSDALFRNYQKEGREKIRDSLRLPPIYTGASSDYNRATADTARQIAEEQIFVPERRRICSVFNKIINNELGIKYCEMYLKSPDLSNIEQKAKIIEVLDKAGAVTPNMLIPIVEELLGKDIEPWSKDLGNIPFELIKVKYQNSAIAATDDIEKSTNEVIDELSRLTEAINSELGGDGDE